MKMKARCLYLLSSLVGVESLIFTSAAWAQPVETEQTAPLPLAGYPSMAGFFLRTVLSLLLITVLTYIVLRFLKRQNSLRQSLKGWIRILDYQALGPNRGIYLMELLDAVYVVSAAEGKLSILLEIDQESEKWQKILPDIEQQIEVSPAGWETLVQKGFGFLMQQRIGKGSFESRLNSQLEEQKSRVRRLSRRAAREDGEDKENE